jgi:hypothetical protein
LATTCLGVAGEEGVWNSRAQAENCKEMSMEPRVITLPAQLCASAPRKPLCMKHFELDLLLLALDKSKGLTWSPGLSLSICGVGCQVPTQTSQWCQGAFEKAKTITKVSETIIHTHTHTHTDEDPSADCHHCHCSKSRGRVFHKTPLFFSYCEQSF